MGKAWWRSWTLWAAIVAIALCYVPVVRQTLRQASLDLVQFQALLHAVLRFKTTQPIAVKDHEKEEG